MNTQDKLNQIKYAIEIAEYHINQDNPIYDMANYHLRRAQALALLSIAESLDGSLREFMTPKAIIK